MKIQKIAAGFLAILMLCIAGCGGESSSGGSLKDGAAMTDIMAAVDEKFIQTYQEQSVSGAVMMAQTMTATEMNEQLVLEETDYTDFSATIAMSRTNSDCVYMIKATKDSLDKVKTALENRRQALIDEYRAYPVSGSYERAVASQVFTKDDCVFFVCVGILPVDMDARPDFAPQVAMAREVIESFFD